jgi:formylglycine-generating enzyme required for sulfatase activity
MGTVRLSVNNENARTILPKENAFKYFLVVFIASDTNSGKTACFYKVGFDEVSVDYTIALGFYKQVKVHVFSSDNWRPDSLCAIGEYNDKFEIKSTGVNDTIEIIIDPFDAGSIPNKEGYFSWKIDNTKNDLNNSTSGDTAKMTIISLPGTSGFSDTIYFPYSPSYFIDSIPLETGIYNVSFEFGKTDFSYVKFSEILYIAPGGAVSYYEYEIPVLASTKISVSYNLKPDNPYSENVPLGTVTFPVGSLFTSLPLSAFPPNSKTNPYDPTETFIGWYKNPELTREWKNYDRVLSSTILYAKWEEEGPPSQITSPTGIVLKLIPAGTFTMGSPVGEPCRQPANEMQHPVTLTKSFYMGKYEVTQEQYQAVMGTNPSYFHGGSGREPVAGENQKKRPVENITWYDVVEFCNKLSVLEGLQQVYAISGRTPSSGYPITSATVTLPTDWKDKSGYRLPTEAESEYACRAGTLTAFYNGNNDCTNAALVGAIAWFGGNDGNSGSRTHQVGLKPANKWGLYDMHGNIHEWVWDFYNDSYYTSDPATDPLGDPWGPSKVICGGAWINEGQHVRSASKLYYLPNTQRLDIGFRLVRGL